VVEKQINKLRQSISRLIDGYAEGYLDKAEAEPRIRRFKERLQALEEQAEQRRDQSQQQSDLQLVIGRVEEFSTKVKVGLEQLDWQGCRELVRTLVKRIEIDQERINVVFRVGDSTFPGGNDVFWQHCGRRGCSRQCCLFQSRRDRQSQWSGTV
jgi:site-specific DNA recombinase